MCSQRISVETWFGKVGDEVLRRDDLVGRQEVLLCVYMGSKERTHVKEWGLGCLHWKSFLLSCLRSQNQSCFTSSSFTCSSSSWSRSRGPRVLRLRSAAARLLRLLVRIPPGAWMSVSAMCCQVEVCATNWSLVQRRPTDCGVRVVCDLETSWMRRSWPTGGLLCQKQTNGQT